MRRSVVLCSAAALSTLFAMHARADCVIPGPVPAAPRGAVATQDEMKTAHDALQAYIVALEAYQKCVETQITNLPADAKPEDKRALRVQGDSAIDFANRLKAAYDQQIQVYKAHHPAPPPTTPAPAPAKK